MSPVLTLAITHSEVEHFIAITFHCSKVLFLNLGQEALLDARKSQQCSKTDEELT